jgi:hypothetical protein
VAGWCFDAPTHVRGGLANGSAWCGSAGERRKAVARLGQRKETTRVGRCWADRLHRPVGQLGQCEAFELREEGGCGGPRWAKRSGRLGALMG